MPVTTHTFRQRMSLQRPIKIILFPTIPPGRTTINYFAAILFSHWILSLSRKIVTSTWPCRFLLLSLNLYEARNEVVSSFLSLVFFLFASYALSFRTPSGQIIAALEDRTHPQSGCLSCTSIYLTSSVSSTTHYPPIQVFTFLRY